METTSLLTKQLNTHLFVPKPHPYMNTLHLPMEMSALDGTRQCKNYGALLEILPQEVCAVGRGGC